MSEAFQLDAITGSDTTAAPRRRTPGQLLKVRAQHGVDPAKAGEGWRSISALYTDLAEIRTGRMDVFCTVAPNATGGLAPGTFDPRTARILLDGLILPASPELLEPATNDSHHKALSALHGVFTHEAGHAAHSVGSPLDYPEDVRDEMVLLEEIRMEAATVRRRAADARFLRACATFLIIGDKSKVELAAYPLAAQAGALTLMEGRVFAGSLETDDVNELVDFCVANGAVTAAIHTQLQAIWQDTVLIADGDFGALEAAARRYQALIPPEDDGGGGGLSKADAEAIIGAMERAAGKAQEDAANGIKAAGSVLIEDLVAAVRDDVKMQERLKAAMAELNDDSGKAAGAPGGKAIKAGLRAATAEERRERNKLANMLRKARWRDRDVTKRAAEVPPGRLRTRMAVQRSAQVAHGKVATAKPWQQKKRRTVEMPRLRAGLLCDTSGSMSSAVAGVSSALWVISNAVYDAGGHSAAYAFGDAMARILDPGKPPVQVLELSSNGGTDHVPQALAAADLALQFTIDQGGPRLMFIISDGMWGSQGPTLIELERLRKIGVKTVHIMIGGLPRDHGTDEIVSIRDVSELASVVGAACINALKSA